MSRWKYVTYYRICECLLLMLPMVLQSCPMAATLRLSQLDIPPTTIVGDTIEMSCLYELDNDSLYAVKWYKNGHEFFRFVPQDWPSGQYLKMDGVRVDVSTSKRGAYWPRRPMIEPISFNKDNLFLPTHIVLISPF